MKVLLIQIDGKRSFPNPALMKLSAYHKQRGDEVGFYVTEPDLIYVSIIYEKHLAQAQGVIKWLTKWHPKAEIQLGGPGLGKPNQLMSEIEEMMPDYSLYGRDFSMGFTSRGCIRACPFCIVPKLEGSIRDGVSIEKFHYPGHSKIVLLDNNLLASPRWCETLQYLIDKKLRVNFNQGLDIRLIDEEKASILSKISAYGWSFKTPMFHFAWDLPEIEEKIRSGIQCLRDAGISLRKMTFYVLAGFNTTHKQDLYRVETLRRLGVDPYIMVYNDRRDDRFIQQLERWVNAPYLRKSFEFNEYEDLSREQAIEAEEILVDLGFKSKSINKTTLER